MALNTDSDTRFRFEVDPLELTHDRQATCRDLQQAILEKFGVWPMLYDGSRKLEPHDMPMMTSTSEGGRAGNLRMVLQGDQIKITVVSPDGRMVQYIMKGAHPIGKMMDRHCEHCNLTLADVTFVYNGANLEPEETLQSLSMTNGESVHVLWKDASKVPKVPLLDSSTSDVGEEAKSATEDAEQLNLRACLSRRNRDVPT